MKSDKRFAPAAERNLEPIIGVLTSLVPQQGAILEIASGTGQHIAAFAARFEALDWQPSDINPQALASITAYRTEANLQNLRAPIVLDTREHFWSCGEVDMVLAINLVHISPWTVSEGLFKGAKRHLRAGGSLVLYGPYQFFGQHVATSNLRFDEELRKQDVNWGVRDLADLGALGQLNSLCLNAIVPMPANNHMVIFRNITSVPGR